MIENTKDLIRQTILLLGGRHKISCSRETLLQKLDELYQQMPDMEAKALHDESCLHYSNWARVTLMVSPDGEMHALNGVRQIGDPAADLPFVGLERIKALIERNKKCNGSHPTVATLVLNDEGIEALLEQRPDGKWAFMKGGFRYHPNDQDGNRWRALLSCGIWHINSDQEVRLADGNYTARYRMEFFYTDDAPTGGKSNNDHERHTLTRFADIIIERKRNEKHS